MKFIKCKILNYTKDFIEAKDRYEEMGLDLKEEFVWEDLYLKLDSINSIQKSDFNKKNTDINVGGTYMTINLSVDELLEIIKGYEK